MSGRAHAAARARLDGSRRGRTYTCPRGERPPRAEPWSGGSPDPIPNSEVKPRIAESTAAPGCGRVGRSARGGRFSRFPRARRTPSAAAERGPRPAPDGSRPGAPLRFGAPCASAGRRAGEAGPRARPMGASRPPGPDVARPRLPGAQTDGGPPGAARPGSPPPARRGALAARTYHALLSGDEVASAEKRYNSSSRLRSL